MSIISRCPKCQRAITIPERTSPVVTVRCPLCEEQYPLSDALADVPPTLIVVDAPAPEGSGSDVFGSGVLAAGAAVDGSGATEPKEGVEQAGEEFEQLVGELEQAGQPEGSGAGDGSGAGGFSISDVEVTDEEEETVVGEGEETDQVRPTFAKTTPSKKRKQKSTFRVLAEPMIGGFVGLAICYYGLNFFGGQQHDFLGIYLPGCPHTYKHWPGRHPADLPGEGAQDFPSPASSSSNGTASPATQDSNSSSSATASASVPTSGKRATGRKHHVLNEVDDDHRTLASLMGEEDSSRPPAMEVPADVKIDLERPDEKPEPWPGDYLGPSDPPLYSSDELGKALKEANEALGGENSGPVSDAAFEKFCTLGEKMTFVRGKPGGDSRLDDRKQAVESILKKLGADPDRCEAVGRMAQALLDASADARAGILLCGISGTPAEKDGLHAASIRLSGQPNKIFVMSDRPLPFAKDNSVMILGTIIPKPAENLSGLKAAYAGPQDRVVWIGTAVDVSP